MNSRPAAVAAHSLGGHVPVAGSAALGDRNGPGSPITRAARVAGGGARGAMRALLRGRRR